MLPDIWKIFVDDDHFHTTAYLSKMHLIIMIQNYQMFFFIKLEYGKGACDYKKAAHTIPSNIKRNSN